MSSSFDGPLGGAVPPVRDDEPVGLAMPQSGADDEAGTTRSPYAGPATEDIPYVPEGTAPTGSTGPGMSSPPSSGTSSSGLSGVASTATEQGGEVVRETGRQARQLMETTREELTAQAAQQQSRIAGGLASLSDELRAMASSTDQPGMASDLAEQAADRLSSAGSWLERREPGQVVDEVRRFAAEKPGTFLAIAVGIGLIAGRATRGMAASAHDAGSESPSAGRHIDIRDAPVQAPMSDLEQDRDADSIASEWTASSVGETVGGDLR
jgi:hypothetical protein